MTNEVIIRKAASKDAGIIRELAEAIWPFTYKDILSPGQIAYMMELFYSKDSLKEQFLKNIFIIAYLNTEAVGFASYSLPLNEGCYKLHKLYVNTAIQGRGIGRELVHYIITEIQLNGGGALQLNVNRDNKAKSFYEKLGFEVISEEDIDIGSGYWMNDFVMRLEV